MSKLIAKDPKTAKPSKPKILIFGKPGVGKTWASLDFPSVYYIDTEGGANLDHYTEKLKASGGMYLGPEDGALDFDVIIQQIQALATEKHHFKTLIIDSLSKVFNAAICSENERLISQKKKTDFGVDRKPAVGALRRIVAWILKMDMNVIFVAHEKALWLNGEQAGSTFDCWDKLEYELHLCLHIEKFAKRRTATVKKSRLQEFEAGESFPWSYQDFAGKYGEDVINAEGSRIELASAEQVAEVEKKTAMLKVEPELIQKWFTKAGVEKFAEMDTTTIEKVIKYLNKQIA